MKKTKLSKVAAVIAAGAACAAFGFAAVACGDEEHTHKWADAWTTNATQHWHVCTAGDDCKDVSGKDDHKDANEDGKCDTCNYTMSTTPVGHEHVWAEAWTSDATDHWHACTVEGCTETNDKAAHGEADEDGKCPTCEKELGGEEDPIDDGVYVNGTAITATIVVNSGNEAEIIITLKLAEETTIQIAYGGAIVGISKTLSGGDAEYLEDGKSIKLAAGEYTMYYTFAAENANYQKIWVQKEVEGPSADKNAGLTYVEGFGATGAYLVGKFYSRGMSAYAWSDGYQMTETETSGEYKLENIYMYVGDQCKIRLGSGDNNGHNVWKEEEGLYNYSGMNCNIEKEGYYTITIDSTGEMKVAYVGETLAA